jgi:hypothetical protein
MPKLPSVILVCLALLSGEGIARAQVSPEPQRSNAWATVTTITMVAGGATELLMPRVFYADPEVTVGWKARWHVSVLAPVMTLTSATLLNELALKNAIKSFRPGCDASNDKLAHCQDYASPSTHAFASFSALGHGAAVFLFDTMKWSDGRFNGGAFAGHVAAPLVLAGITGIGRSVGDWESFGQVVAGAGIGLGIGFLSGLTYSLMQRPECGYTGSVICW